MKLNKWTVALAAAGLVSLGQNAQAEEAGHWSLTEQGPNLLINLEELI